MGWEYAVIIPILVALCFVLMYLGTALVDPKDTDDRRNENDR